jgi:hypothetical protein
VSRPLDPRARETGTCSNSARTIPLVHAPRRGLRGGVLIPPPVPAKKSAGGGPDVRRDFSYPPR